MVDWLVAWGVAQAVGFVFKPILEDLAKDAAKDFAKDFLKDSLKHVLLPDKEPLNIALGKAIKEFLQLVQQQLEVADLSEAQQKQYTEPLKKFLKNKSVKEVLGSAFKDDCQGLDTKKLATIWNELNLLSLPDEFSWKQVAKLYLNKVKAIIRESPQLRSILDSQNIEATAQNTKELAGIVPGFELEQYQEGIRERYGNLNLQSLDTSGSAYNELKLWRIFIAQNVREFHDVLPQVHELPKEHLRQLKESNHLEAEISSEQLEQSKRVYVEQPIRSVLDVINDHQTYKYVVILGDPGSGKSTLLQFLALNWAESPLNNVISLPIPLLIELRTYMRSFDSGQCNNFLEFFHKSPGSICHLNQHQLDEQLKAGKALVMFDGLDEVFDPGKREDVITCIHRFTNEYPNVRVIVTSRVIGYKHQRLRDAQFRHFMLQDLDEKQIKDFINRWHDLTFNDEVDKVRKRERLQRAIETSTAIGELAGNPLLLTMMAILNRHQELPRDRAELYNQASRILLHQWDVERALREHQQQEIQTIDYKDKQKMLRQVAYHMQAAEKGLAGNLIRADNLERILTEYLKTILDSNPRVVARLMIEQLRTRNFILCYLGADYYAFVHRTFLEYFCAWEFVCQFTKTQKLKIGELKTEVFGKHWQDETWHEVLRLIAGMLEANFTGEIIEYLIQINGETEKFINLSLAAKCLFEVRNRSGILTTTTQLLKRLKDLTKYDLPYYYERYGDEAEVVREIRTQAVAAVATTWKDDPDTLPWLKQRATSDDEGFVRYTAVQELARGWKDDQDTLPLLKQWATSDDEWYVRRAALQELARGWKDDQDTLPLLKQWATSDDQGLVRSAALQELARGWKDDQDTLPLLKQWATSDDNWYVRTAALQELARGWKDDQDTLPLLKQWATSDDDGDVRTAALQELARGWKDDQDTLPLLKQRATSDDNESVRRAALQELARGWKDDQDTLPLLKQWATSDDNESVRRAALQELARGWKDDQDTLPLLKQRATSDDNESVRRAALQELARGWKDDQDTLPLLKQRATSDDQGLVRTAALQELARGWKDDQDTLPLLKQRATSDDQGLVRTAALQELARGWKDDQDTLPLLKQWATSDDNESVRRAALQELARGWKDDQDTLPLLKQRATSDDQGLVRRAALQELARGWKDDQDTLPLLKQRATSDDNESVRRAALQELARGWKDDQDTLPLLKQGATSDDDGDVRTAALQELARGWKDDQDTLPLLKQGATSDDDGDVRTAALQELARGWKDDQDTLPLLKQRATSDDHGNVRYTAVQELARGWKDEPGMFEFLRDIALNDPFERKKDWEDNPRQLALEVILRQYPDHPQTLSLCKDRAENDPDEKVREFAQKKLAKLEE